MREEIIKLYQFDELSPESQEKALQKWRENNGFTYESEAITGNFTSILDELGYPTDDIEWRLSNSQGDGVAFYGYVDMDKITKRLLDDVSLELYERMVEEELTISIKIKRNSYGYHYSHYNTMEIDIDGDSIDTIITYLYESNGEELTTEEWDEKHGEIVAFIDDLRTEVLDDVKEVSRELERRGYDEIEYYNSDEVITETIRANSYEFTEGGKMY